MKNKKTIFVILVSILIFAFGVYFFLFNTYSVSGKIIDLASKKAIADVEISIGDVIATTNKDGAFKIEGIKKYQSNILKIKTPIGYEEVASIPLKSGGNNIQNIEIAPTLETMVSRINDALRNNQYDYLWDYMYPDDQKYWESKEKYVALFKKVEDIKKELGLFSVPNYEIGKNIRKLDTWKHPITGKEYTDIMEVPTEARTSETMSAINLGYFKKIDGVWRYFTNTDKEQSQKEIDKYEESKNSFSN